MTEQTEEEQKVINKMNRMVGYVPVGTLDLLRVLTHPEIIDSTHALVTARLREDKELDDAGI